MENKENTAYEDECISVARDGMREFAEECRLSEEN